MEQSQVMERASARPESTLHRRAAWSLATALGLATTLGGCSKPAPDEHLSGFEAKPPGSVAASSSGGNTTDPGYTGGFTKVALLEAAASCAVARYDHFEATMRELRGALQTLVDTRDAASLELSRQSWRSAIASWQQAELFRFGPMGRAGTPGALDLRDNIYAWPLISRCKIEEQLVNQAYAAPSFSTSLINGRGLGAIEYLLFYEGTDNTCSSFSVINANGTWAALGADALAQRKAEYALAAAKDVLERATELTNAWAPSGGDFRTQLVTAGRGSQVYASEQAALNAISDALFYLENEVKDDKIGKPVGLYECFTASCPEAIESQYARASTDHLRANVRGFRQLFQGCGEDNAGVGFDDWLSAVGAEEIATAMLHELGEAERAIDTLSPPLEQAIVTDIDQARAVHTALKRFTDILKTEFVTVLNLDLPKGAEGDND